MRWRGHGRRRSHLDPLEAVRVIQVSDDLGLGGRSQTREVLEQECATLRFQKHGAIPSAVGWAAALGSL